MRFPPTRTLFLKLNAVLCCAISNPYDRARYHGFHCLISQWLRIWYCYLAPKANRKHQNIFPNLLLLDNKRNSFMEPYYTQSVNELSNCDVPKVVPVNKHTHTHLRIRNAYTHMLSLNGLDKATNHCKRRRGELWRKVSRNTYLWYFNIYIGCVYNTWM